LNASRASQENHVAIWKQLGLCLVILAVAAVIWARYFPGADERLAEWGIDWLPVAQTAASTGGT
jgi:hypothetical protein